MNNPLYVCGIKVINLTNGCKTDEQITPSVLEETGLSYQKAEESTCHQWHPLTLEEQSFFDSEGLVLLNGLKFHIDRSVLFEGQKWQAIYSELSVDYDPADDDVLAKNAMLAFDVIKLMESVADQLDGHVISSHTENLTGEKHLHSTYCFTLLIPVSGILDSFVTLSEWKENLILLFSNAQEE